MNVYRKTAMRLGRVSKTDRKWILSKLTDLQRSEIEAAFEDMSNEAFSESPAFDDLVDKIVEGGRSSLAQKEEKFWLDSNRAYAKERLSSLGDESKQLIIYLLAETHSKELIDCFGEKYFSRAVKQGTDVLSYGQAVEEEALKWLYS